MAAPPKVGWVRVSSKDPPIVIDARLSEEKPDVSNGYGGWDEIARPRRKTLTTWRGSPALHMTLGILLDGYLTQHIGTTGRGRQSVSVEPQISQLQRLGSPSSSAGEPPIVHIQATGAAVPGQGRAWVVSDLSFGDAIMGKNGNRVRQAVTLTLVEHVVDVYLSSKAFAAQRKAKVARATVKHGAAEKRTVAARAAKKTAVKKKSGRAATVEFGGGESLDAIAARELGDADRWIEIAQLNGLRDPRAVEPGQVLRLP